MFVHIVVTPETVSSQEISALNAVTLSGSVASAVFSSRPLHHRTYAPSARRNAIFSMSLVIRLSVVAPAILTHACSKKLTVSVLEVCDGS